MLHLWEFFVVVCGAGTFNDGANCTNCPIGQYQDLVGQSACKSCPSGSTTRQTGTNNIAMCLCELLIVMILHDKKAYLYLNR